MKKKWEPKIQRFSVRLGNQQESLWRSKLARLELRDKVGSQCEPADPTSGGALRCLHLYLDTQNGGCEQPGQRQGLEAQASLVTGGIQRVSKPILSRKCMWNMELFKAESWRSWESLTWKPAQCGACTESRQDIANEWVGRWKKGAKEEKKRGRTEQNRREELRGGQTAQQSPGKTQMLNAETRTNWTRIGSLLQTNMFSRVVGSKQYMKT